MGSPAESSTAHVFLARNDISCQVSGYLIAARRMVTGHVYAVETGTEVLARDVRRI